MKNSQIKTRSAVRRDQAENYILTSLIAFAATVIVTRAFLELTGYPQIGNSVLHIAHALWGGLLLIVATYLPLAYANRWALQASAVLGGIGVGLFIDEIGKFITQANDYFFPPAFPLIYGFILLNVLVYLYFRRPHKENIRSALYHALEGLQDLLDGDLDTAKGVKIEEQLVIASQSNRAEIVSLANVLRNYLHQEEEHLSEAEPGFWKRFTLWIDEFGQRLGRQTHRVIISVVLIGWMFLVAGYVILIVRGGANLDPQVLQWRAPLIGVQVAVGILLVIAALLWLIQKEDLGLKFGVSGFLISLVALQLLYFYLSQFSAITATLLQLVILQMMFAYRRWYLSDIKG
jgi:hypothetical protein